MTISGQSGSDTRAHSKMRILGASDAEVDCHLGARIMTRRLEMRVTEADLAEALEVSLRQVQKYERGDKRIAASKLWLAARHLNVGMAYFFEGLQPHGRSCGVTEAAGRGRSEGAS
jgi:transcriptional regulator with XRE-family HTH domain